MREEPGAVLKALPGGAARWCATGEQLHRPQQKDPRVPERARPRRRRGLLVVPGLGGRQVKDVGREVGALAPPGRGLGVGAPGRGEQSEERVRRWGAQQLRGELRLLQEGGVLLDPHPASLDVRVGPRESEDAHAGLAEREGVGHRVELHGRQGVGEDEDGGAPRARGIAVRAGGGKVVLPEGQSPLGGEAGQPGQGGRGAGLAVEPRVVEGIHPLGGAGDNHLDLLRPRGAGQARERCGKRLARAGAVQEGGPRGLQIDGDRGGALSPAEDEGGGGGVVRVASVSRLVGAAGQRGPEARHLGRRRDQPTPDGAAQQLRASTGGDAQQDRPREGGPQRRGEQHLVGARARRGRGGRRRLLGSRARPRRGVRLHPYRVPGRGLRRRFRLRGHLSPRRLGSLPRGRCLVGRFGELRRAGSGSRAGRRNVGRDGGRRGKAERPADVDEIGVRDLVAVELVDLPPPLGIAEFSFGDQPERVSPLHDDAQLDLGRRERAGRPLGSGEADRGARACPVVGGVRGHGPRRRNGEGRLRGGVGERGTRRADGGQHERGHHRAKPAGARHRHGDPVPGRDGHDLEQGGEGEHEPRGPPRRAEQRHHEAPAADPGERRHPVDGEELRDVPEAGERPRRADEERGEGEQRGDRADRPHGRAPLSAVFLVMSAVCRSRSP